MRAEKRCHPQIPPYPHTPVPPDTPPYPLPPMPPYTVPPILRCYPAPCRAPPSPPYQNRAKMGPALLRTLYRAAPRASFSSSPYQRRPPYRYQGHSAPPAASRRPCTRAARRAGPPVSDGRHALRPGRHAPLAGVAGPAGVRARVGAAGPLERQSACSRRCFGAPR